LLGILSTVVGFLPAELPRELSEYVSIQGVQSVDFSCSFILRLVSLLLWFLSYLYLFKGNGKFLYISN